MFWVISLDEARDSTGSSWTNWFWITSDVIISGARMLRNADFRFPYEITIFQIIFILCFEWVKLDSIQWLWLCLAKLSYYFLMKNKDLDKRHQSRLKYFLYIFIWILLLDSDVHKEEFSILYFCFVFLVEEFLSLCCLFWQHSSATVLFWIWFVVKCVG